MLLKLADTWVAKPVSIGEEAGSIERIAEKIRTVQAVLKVTAYPWGVDFEVCDMGTVR